MIPLDSASVPFLASVEKRLREILGEGRPNAFSPPELLVEAARNLVLAGGAKRIRPLLVRHFGRTLCGPDPGWVDFAATAELIHSASLLHDDVIDGATTRRYVVTANSAWGNSVAILSGDWLLCRALQNLETHDPGIARAAVGMVGRMTEASMFEVLCRGRLDVTEDRWRNTAEGKTGSLFEWCALSPLWGEGESARRRLGSCARGLGVAFQMMDDLKDLSRAATGKDECADLRNRSLNFAVSLAAQGFPNLRREVEKVWSREPVGRDEARRLAEKLMRSEVPGRVVEEARREVAGALEFLGSLGGTEGGKEVVRWAQRLADSGHA